VALHNRVGKHVLARAAALVEYARKSVIGDGSASGFVQTVLEQVPAAHAAVMLPAASTSGRGGELEYGPLIYVQSGNAVQKKASDIMPGDIAVVTGAKLKGHKGLSSYSVQVEWAVGIVNEWEDKKGKLKLWQASVESVSYRLDDLKSGQIKVSKL
ncbi:hypothetical protein DL93DRAFT_2038861, partial [Clavulina sp. PMI_390]